MSKEGLYLSEGSQTGFLRLQQNPAGSFTALFSSSYIGTCSTAEGAAEMFGDAKVEYERTGTLPNAFPNRGVDVEGLLRGKGASGYMGVTKYRESGLHNFPITQSPIVIE
jgi:hypothetical protein